MLIVNALIEKQRVAESAQSLIANLESESENQTEGKKRERKAGRRAGGTACLHLLCAYVLKCKFFLDCLKSCIWHLCLHSCAFYGNYERQIEMYVPPQSVNTCRQNIFTAIQVHGLLALDRPKDKLKSAAPLKLTLYSLL